MPGLKDAVDSLIPEDGFALVEIEGGEPVADAAHVLADFDDEGQVVIPPDTGLETYVVYGADGETYTRDSWPEPASEP